MNNAGNNTKKQWQLINNFVKGDIKYAEITTLKINDTVINNPKEIVNKFNEYFCGVGPKIPYYPHLKRYSIVTKKF